MILQTGPFGMICWKSGFSPHDENGVVKRDCQHEEVLYQTKSVEDSLGDVAIEVLEHQKHGDDDQTANLKH